MQTILLQGDCQALLPTLPDASVDLVVTDLPYLRTPLGGGSGDRLSNIDNICMKLLR